MSISTTRVFSLFLCVGITKQKNYPCDSNAPCGCSLNSASINARIVDGETAASNTWSWAAFLKAFGTSCGGAIISDSYIMTAGHCVNEANVEELTAYVGSTGRSQGQVRGVSQIYLHPEFYQDPAGHYILNDIALLKLSVALNMTDKTLAKVCLPDSNLVLPNNTDVVAIG
jgi:secreted trypsin-like serine protease